MKTTFEEYLQQVCPYGLTLDDDMPDFYDKWFSRLEAEEVMKHAQDFGTQQTTTNFLLPFLEDIKKEIEADGYIATIEEAIIRLKNEL